MGNVYCCSNPDPAQYYQEQQELQKKRANASPDQRQNTKLNTHDEERKEDQLIDSYRAMGTTKKPHQMKKENVPLVQDNNGSDNESQLSASVLYGSLHNPPKQKTQVDPPFKRQACKTYNSSQVQQDIPFNLGYSQAQDNLRNQIYHQNPHIMMMGMNNNGNQGKHTFSGHKSLDKKMSIQYQMGSTGGMVGGPNFYRPPSSGDFHSSNHFYGDDYKRSSSFVMQNSAGNANGQRHFQMSVNANDFMYNPSTRVAQSQPFRDETQNIQYGFSQGSQGGQTASRISPLKQAQIPPIQTKSINITNSAQQQMTSDRQEILTLLNETIAKVSINGTNNSSNIVSQNGSTQMKIVGSSSQQQSTQSSSFTKSGYSQSSQQASGAGRHFQ